MEGNNFLIKGKFVLLLLFLAFISCNILIITSLTFALIGRAICRYSFKRYWSRDIRTRIV